MSAFTKNEAKYIIYSGSGGAGGPYYALNGVTGKVDVSGSVASTVINTVLTGSGYLTAGRTWEEKVLLKGYFVINAPLQITSYTILELDGKVMALTGSSFTALLITGSNPINYVTIRGGTWDGNKDNNAVCCGFYLIPDTSSYPVIIENLNIINIKLTGSLLYNISTKMDYVTVNGSDSIGFSFISCSDSFITRLVTTNVKAEAVRMTSGCVTNVCNDWYLGGTCDPTYAQSSAQLYISSGVRNHFNDIRVDYPVCHGIYLYGCRDNIFTNTFVTYAGQANYGALYVDTSYNNTFYGLTINDKDKGAQAAAWDIGIYEANGSNANLYSGVNMRRCTTLYQGLGAQSKIKMLSVNTGSGLSENQGYASVATTGTIAHGLTKVPKVVSLTASGSTPIMISYIADATNITVYHTGVGSSGIFWRAEI